MTARFIGLQSRINTILMAADRALLFMLKQVATHTLKVINKESKLRRPKANNSVVSPITQKQFDTLAVTGSKLLNRSASYVFHRALLSIQRQNDLN